MTLAVLVTVAATTAAVAAVTHSKRVLQDEQNTYPAGTLKPRQAAEVNGVEVRIDDADVLDSVPSTNTRGYGMEVAPWDRRFLRLVVYVHNKSLKPVRVDRALRDLRQVEIATGNVASKRVVWLRGYDALPAGTLKPGEDVEGKVALDVTSFALSLPFLVLLGNGGPCWGLDVIDHDATNHNLLR